MTFRISETIHKWMGWCPVKAGMAAPAGIEGYKTEPDQVPGSNEGIIYDKIVDYSSTGTSVWRLLLFGMGIAIIVSFIKLATLVFFAADMILLTSFMIAAAFVIVYTDKKRTNIKYGPGNLIIQRPLFKPVLIQKDEITAMELRENKRPLPKWLTAVTAFILVPVYSAFCVYRGLFSCISGGVAAFSFIIGLGFYIILVIFVLSIYSYSDTRRRFPKIFVITTKQNKSLMIYTKNSEELTELQERLL